jgi:hypothetical protein
MFNFCHHFYDGYVTSDDEIYSKQGKKTDSNTKHATIGTGDDLQDDTKQVIIASL